LGDWNPAKFTIEDSGFAFLRMEDGATIILEASWALNILDAVEEQVTLCGTKAGIDMMDGVRINRAQFGRLVVTKPDVPLFSPQQIPSRGVTPPGELEIRLFLDCIKNNTDPFVLPEQALIVTRIIEANYESEKTGKPVYF
jgi:predicted dehydrogenase